MRNALLAVVVGVASLSMFGCGDASSSSGIQRRPNVSLPGGDDGEPSIGEDGTDPGNPNANAPPAAPATPGQTAGEFGVTLSNATPAVDLGDQLELTVTIEPKAGFKGDAALTATGLPAGATATFTPASVTLNTTAATAKLLLKVPVTSVPSAPGASSAVVITATSGTVVATANASFKINPKMKLTIPVNIDALRSTGTKFLDQWDSAFGANPTALKTQTGNGIVVTVYNADSKGHIVHGNNGFQHGATTYTDAQGATQAALIPPNSFEPSVAGNPASPPRTRTLNPGASVNGYPHEGGAGASAGFQISVVAAP
jgi:hypothetical protein